MLNLVAHPKEIHCEWEVKPLTDNDKSHNGLEGLGFDLHNTNIISIK